MWLLTSEQIADIPITKTENVVITLVQNKKVDYKNEETN